MIDDARLQDVYRLHVAKQLAGCYGSENQAKKIVLARMGSEPIWPLD